VPLQRTTTDLEPPRRLFSNIARVKDFGLSFLFRLWGLVVPAITYGFHADELSGEFIASMKEKKKNAAVAVLFFCSIIHGGTLIHPGGNHR